MTDHAARSDELAGRPHVHDAVGFRVPVGTPTQHDVPTCECGPYTDPVPVDHLTRRQFFRHLAGYAVGSTVNAVTVREDAVTAAQIPTKRLGGLFQAAAKAGLIRPSGYINVPGEKSRGHLARNWYRTSKPVDTGSDG